jgi:hypothetical protein
MTFAGLLAFEIGLAALLSACSLGLRSASATLLATYVLLIAAITFLTTALSPFRWVTREGLFAGVTALLVAAGLVWLVAGTPTPPLPRFGPLRRPDAAVFLLGVAVAASWVYELVLVLGAPPNNWDSLTYHLARAAAWAQHGGVYWIPHVPTDRMNEFQPLAEQQVLFLFAAAGRAVLFALPQYLAGLAASLSVFVAARRLGYAVSAAAFAALLFASFPLIALESTTAQNDLVAAALPAVAAALILDGAAAGVVVAGIGLGLAPGVKLTTAFVLPVPFALAWLRGRAAFLRVAIAAAASFLLLAVWGFVLNAQHTGHLLGYGRSLRPYKATPSLVGTPTSLFMIVYRQLDLSGFGYSLTLLLAGVGVVAGTFVACVGALRGHRRAAIPAGSLIALVLAAPRLTPDVAHGLHIAADALGLPVAAQVTAGARFFWGVSGGASEDLSSFGVLGGPLLIALSTVVLLQRRKVVLRWIALALPLFLVLLSLTSKYNPWLSRFLIVPVALAAPLLAGLERRRAAALAIGFIAALQLALVHVHNQQKPLHAQPRPWNESQAQALSFTFRSQFGTAYAALGRRVPAGACVGAAVGADDPSFLLFGDSLQRRLTFLPLRSAWSAATAAGLRFVVVAPGSVAAAFAKHGWAVRPLAAESWSLAVQPLRAAATSATPAVIRTKSGGSATKRNRGCSAVM